MSVSLSTLITRLQLAVPAHNSVPTDTQYEYAVKDSVGDYSRRAPMRKEIELNIVSGTATYNLPSDFVRMLSLQSMTSPSGVILGDQGIIPVSGKIAERYGIQGLTITIYPTPEYSAERLLWYFARHELDVNNDYPFMTDDDAAILMLKAQATALLFQANVAAQQAWQYAIGDESVNKTSLVTALRTQAQQYEAQYAEAIKQLSSGKPAGTRVRYSDYARRVSDDA